MNSWIWVLIGLISVFLVVYPYFIYPVILNLLPKKKYNNLRHSNSGHPKVALLFCAYNEEKSLPEKIKNIQQLKEKWPSLEVYGYSDASSDCSNDLLLAASDVLHPVIGEERLGKALGMRKLVSMTNADILVFTDANVLLEPGSLPKLIQYFSNPEIGCVSGQLLYGGIDSTTAKVGGIYWKLEEKIKELESRTGSTMGADGAIFARRKEGYPVVQENLLDDMTSSISVLFDNQRCISATDVFAYENAISCSTEEFRRKKRIACRSFSTYLHLRGKLKKMSSLNKFKFVSHKLIRWWGALFIILGLFSLVMWGVSIGLGSITILTVCIGIFMIVVLGKAGVPRVSTVYQILLAIFATWFGVLESLSGRNYQIWNTADTR